MSKRQGCKEPLSTVLVLKTYTKDHHGLLVVARHLACNTKDRFMQLEHKMDCEYSYYP